MKRTKRLLLCCFGILLVAGWQTVLADDSETWMSGVPTVHSYAIDSTQNKICRQVSDIRAMNPSYPDGVTVDGCLYEGLYLDLLKTNGLQGSRLYVKFSNEQYFRALDADMSSYLVPGTDMLVLKTVRGSEPTQVAIYRSLSDALQPQTYNSENVVTSYNLDSSQSTRVLPETTPSLQNHLVYNEAFSANGKYMVAYVNREGYVKINLETMTATIIAHARTDWSSGPPPRAAAISRDGRYALIDNGAKIVDTSGCGDAFGSGFIRNNMEYPCDVNELTNYIQRSAGYFARGENYAFTDQDRSIEFDMYESGIYEPHHVRIDQPGYVRDTTRLEYLALGDSYSSGEGDIGVNSEGMNFYLPLTDIDEDNCHLSSRSYPFLLRDAWGLYPEQMKSVACSGARVIYDYSRPLEGYLGQDSRMQYKTSINDMQKTALDRFIPGWIPQLEFVKKYQPKVITITGGGNDVGFADIIRYCASDAAETIAVGYNCGYVEGGDLHQILNDAIDSQYINIKDTIESIKAAAPTAKLYYVGYPSFIASYDEVCSLNSGVFLIEKERKVINEAVTRLNGVIRQAAAATGVQYVDIEESLYGGRLCEGSEYMTGVLDVGIFSGKYTQSFHPNSRGHARMSASILDADVSPTGVYQPSEVSTASIIEPVVPTYGASVVENAELYEREMLKIRLLPGDAAGSSEVLVSAFSEYTSLGTYTTAPDGSLSEQIKLPDAISQGRHLIILEVMNRSNSKMRLFQYVTVNGPEKELETTDDNPEAEKTSQHSENNDNIVTVKQSTSTELIEHHVASRHFAEETPILKMETSEPVTSIDTVEVTPVRSPTSNIWYILTGILSLLVLGGIWLYVKKDKK